ncbi:MAG TPA: DnaJ C-terminal domain-containing protein, partial [Kofleriaceae bacterium]|nr:DnaJ C-terminal domain-containing protein [Kofleriaceae bacterium]
MASLYDTLGVAKDATPDTIRSAYRKLARKHHPDVNPGNKEAEEKFKAISVAYDVLSDEKKRKAYDEFGDASLQGGFDAEKAREYARWKNTRQQRTSGFSDGPAEFDFSELFGRARGRGPARGQDLAATIQIEFRQAIEGAEFTADIPGQGPVRVRIPPGANTGSTLRVPGKGSPGRGGGPSGDLVIEVDVKPHPRLRREGLDLYLSLPVTIEEAYNGATIEVPTFEGSISLKIPPRSQNRAKLRVKGRGVPRKQERGDFYVEL